MNRDILGSTGGGLTARASGETPFSTRLTQYESDCLSSPVPCFFCFWLIRHQQQITHNRSFNSLRPDS